MAFKLVTKDTVVPALPNIDWSKCFICKEETGEKLICPLDHPGGGAGYRTLADNLSAFHDLGQLPSTIKLDRFDKGNGLESTFREQHAKYHKSCSLKYNDKNLQRVLNRRKSDEISDIPEKFTRRKANRSSNQDTTCLFCNESGTPTNLLRNASTEDHDTKVRQCAINLQDQNLLAKLSRGDVAIEMKYHAKCLVSLYNRDRSKSNTAQTITTLDSARNTAFAELISHMQDILDGHESTPVFQLSELTKLYTSRIQQLQNDTPSSVHATRLKNKILGYFPQLEAHNEGRDVLLVPSGTAGKSIRTTCQLSSESETVLFARVADIIRHDMFANEYPSFDGNFASDCQQSSVPSSLLTLVAMILNGTSIKNEGNYKSQAALSLSQLMLYNALHHRATGARHSKDREPPLPLFLGAYLHSKTRSKDIINTLHQMGLSVTYDRILCMSSDLANSAIDHFESVGAVCPQPLKIGIFTTSAVDNIDHDPTATSSQTSFHGTGISLFQHPDVDNTGIYQNRPLLSSSGRRISKLPNSYTAVPAVEAIKNPHVPERTELKKPDAIVNLEAELQWCQHVCDIFDMSKDSDTLINESNPNRKNASWGAYHANNQNRNNILPAISTLLPLFPDDSKSVAMIRHSMDIVRKAVNVANNGQIPIIACDQPLFKIAKEIQWTWPETYGEDLYVVMLGGLHIKMALLKYLGDLLDGSGWTSAISQAKIASSGTADSFLKAFHVKKTIRAHQVTACALYILRQYAYKTDDPDLSLEDWSIKKRDDNAQFRFWELILDTELTILTWDRAIHEGNFPLYVETLCALQWIFHALDHPHYAKAVAVHLRDMLTLQDRHPTVYAEFCKGNIAVNRSNRPFSKMPIDESHEQNNACVKDEGGAIGLTEKPTALLRWMVAGPEMDRVVTEFLGGLDIACSDTQLGHHEDNPGTQETFLRHVKSLVDTIAGMGNVFMESSRDLVVFDSRLVADCTIVDSFKKIKQIGQDRCDKFFENRLIARTTPIHETITKVKLPLFGKNLRKDKSREKNQLEAMKRDRSLFSTLYIVCQARQTDMAEFFLHENQLYPPSLSDYGTMRRGTKSDLLECLAELVPNHDTVNPDDAQMIVLDGAAIINMIKPGISDSFDDYITKIMEYIRKQFIAEAVVRVDMVFDIYREDSLKTGTRQKRGKGTRRHVEGKHLVPSNWQEFLRNDENKSELFNLIAERVVDEIFPGIIIITNAENVLSSASMDVDGLMACTHEEADTRMFVHASHGAQHGLTKILLRTMDTDVVVIGISLAWKIGCECLWLAFGTGTSFRYLDVAAIAKALALTGCDVTSSFAGKGKRTTWSAWEAFDDATAALCTLSKMPSQQNVLDVLPTIDRFVVIMYDRGSTESSVNVERQLLFTHKSREIENIPPTQDALTQHLLRVGYEAGHVWGQAILKSPHLPRPSDFGWIWETSTSQWKIKWMTLPPAGDACRVVIKCGCTKGCKGQCKCRKGNLPCTTLCK